MDPKGWSSCASSIAPSARNVCAIVPIFPFCCVPLVQMMKPKKTEVTDKLRQEINKVVNRYIDQGEL